MKPSLRQLERHVRNCAADSSNIGWTRHAELRMRQRAISRPMVLDVLRQGVLIRPPEPALGVGMTYRMERFAGGKQVAVVVYLEYPAPDLTVITVIDVHGD